MSGFVDDLNGAVKGNPIAASLIGVGVLLMVFGRPRMPRAVSGAARGFAGAIGATMDTAGTVAKGALAAGSGAAAIAGRAGDGVLSKTSDAAGQVVDTLTGAYDSVAKQAVTSASHAADAIKEAAQVSVQSGMGYARTLQSDIGDVVNRQPMMLGAMGLAIGAGIAAAFPVTQLETDVMGEAGAAVTERVQHFASDLADRAATRADQVADDLLSEAKARGITPQAAREAISGAADAAKSVADAARNAAKRRLS